MVRRGHDCRQPADRIDALLRAIGTSAADGVTASDRRRGRAGAQTSQRRRVNHTRVGVLLELTGPIDHVLTHRAHTVTAMPLPT